MVKDTVLEDDLTIEEMKEGITYEQESNIEESKSKTKTKKKSSNYLRKSTLKYNYAISSRYLLLTALLVPSTLTFFMVISWWNYDLISYSIVFWAFIMTSIFSAFAGPYYYYNAIHFFREQKKKFQLKSHLFQGVLKAFSLLTKGIRYLLIYGIMFLICIFYIFYFLYSMPKIYTILVVILELLYFELILVKQSIKGNIATNLRRIYTCVATISLLVSSILLLLSENMQFMIFTIPVFTLVSFIMYKTKVLDRIGKAFLLLRNGIIRLSDKIGFISFSRRLKTSAKKFVLNFNNFKYRKLIIVAGALFVCILFVIYEKNLTINALDDISSFIILSTILVCFFIYLSIAIISYKIKSLNIYHNYKVKALWISLISIFFIYSYIFIFFPQYIIVPVLLIIVSSLLFTKKKKSVKSKVCRAEKKYSNRVLNDLGMELESESTKTQIRKDKNTRAVILIAIFLIAMPFLVFSISSIITLNRPDIQFASVSQESRIKSPEIDLKSLEFYPSIDNIETISFNGMYITRSPISTLLGESATMHVRFIPKNVPEVEGHRLKGHYDTSSNYKIGPLSNYDLITEVPLDSLGVLPGVYKVEETYSVLTGFSYRYAVPEIYDITIEKDELKSLANNPFSEPINMGYEYESVYTFEYQANNRKWWNVIYDGKIVDSLNKGVKITNLSLYLENNNRFIEVAKVDTDIDGNFYYNHSVYGSIETNALAKVSYEGDGLYKSLEHIEYAGLERPIDGQRFFHDTDGNNYPDWPYSLYDLLKMAGTEIRYAIPFQPENFTFSKGSFQLPYGDLEFDDFNETLIDSEFTQGASGQGTFGYNSIGSSSRGHGKNVKFGSKFTLVEDGSVTSISAYMGLGGGAKNPKEAVGAIYLDNSGADQLIAYTPYEIIGSDAWYTFTFSSAENLQAGDYWLVILTGTKIDIFGESSGGSSEYNSDSYSDGPTSTFGASTSDSWQYSIYADYIGLLRILTILMLKLSGV